jgi:hypothetical protein
MSTTVLAYLILFMGFITFLCGPDTAKSTRMTQRRP